jgi:hypothetical protein
MGFPGAVATRRLVGAALVAALLIVGVLGAACGSGGASTDADRADVSQANAVSELEREQARREAAAEKAARRRANAGRWKRAFESFSIKMTDASGTLSATFYDEYLSTVNGYWSDTTHRAINVLWDCSYRLGRLGGAPNRILSDAREAARRACKHYENAVNAFDRAWTEGKDGLIFHAEDELLYGDLELGSGSVSGESQGFRSGDLDCTDVGGPFSLVGPDPNNLDGDGDGIACEAGY